MSSVQSEYASYPGGLSADLTPVIDYLSGILISPLDGTFVQAFQAAGASSPGEGLGRFRSVRMRLRALWKRRISSLRIVPGGRGRQSVIERPDCHAGLRCTGHRRPVRGPGAEPVAAAGGRDCGHAAGDPQTRAGFRVVASIVSPLLRVFVASVPCGVGWSDRRSRMRPLKGIHRVQNGLHYGFVAYGRVDHQVKELARRPFHSEVLLDKGGAFTVNRPGKFNRLLLGLSPLLEATDLPFKGRIKENVKHAG